MRDFPSSRDEALEAGVRYFFTNKPCAHGHLVPRYTSNKSCIACAKRAGRAYRKKHPDYSKDYIKSWRGKNQLRSLLINVKHRAKQDGIFFSLHYSELTIPETCPCCGTHMRANDGILGDDSLTLDRADKSGGYTTGNVDFICHRCSRLKSDATADELEMIAGWIRRTAAATTPRPSAAARPWSGEDPRPAKTQVSAQSPSPVRRPGHKVRHTAPAAEPR
jgi:hypothetical protein